MANTSSAKKRTRVIERKTKIREMQKSKIKSLIKSVESSISKKDQKSVRHKSKTSAEHVVIPMFRNVLNPF